VLSIGELDRVEREHNVLKVVCARTALYAVEHYYAQDDTLLTSQLAA
jgi:hypothetical protein